MRFKSLLFVLAILSFAAPAHAAIEPDYDPSKPPVTTPWFAHVGAAERLADLRFIEGMRPHHAGALTMSDDYLKSADASDPRLKRLARGIVHNQTFEIGMLDVVEGFMKPEAPHHGKAWRQVATQGLAQKQKFVRAPLPPVWGTRAVSAEDVRFAKAMIVHHEGALTMCDDYLNDPHAKNKYLRLLCIDIKKDQKLDIDFMNSVIADYPGNAGDIKIDPSMIHGMEGMMHGAGGHGGHTKQPPKASHHGHH